MYLLFSVVIVLRKLMVFQAFLASLLALLCFDISSYLKVKMLEEAEYDAYKHKWTNILKTEPLFKNLQNYAVLRKQNMIGFNMFTLSISQKVKLFV